MGAPARKIDRGAFPYRMKDLCDRTGLPRQVIHFYVQQGLLPEGHKTGRNMAYYGEAHLSRLKLIRQLQHERFLPLKAIRAVLDETDDAFTKEQRRLLLDVKHRLEPMLGAPKNAALVPLHSLLLKTGVSRDEAAEIEKLGLFTVVKKGGRACIAKDDAWLVELWGEMRAAGFSRALGFAPEDLLVFAGALDAMFARETTILKARLAHLPGEEVARMVERAIPLLNQFMARYHESLVKSFFTSLKG